MIKAYIDFWKRAFDFRGRSTRPDFWWTYLVNVIIMTILVVFCILIPLFSNVDFNDPALLNNPAELRQLIMGYAWPVMLFGLIELHPTIVPPNTSLARCRLSSSMGTSKLYGVHTDRGFILNFWKHCTFNHVLYAK